MPVINQLSPEHISAFREFTAISVLALCFFLLLTIVIPFVVFFIARAYTRSMQAMSDAFMHALDKRDDDQKKITETLDKMTVRLATLESKVDRIGGPPLFG